jgi:hypothetical protein
MPESLLRDIEDPHSVVTPIDSGMTFPESLRILLPKYEPAIALFQTMVLESASSAELLGRIRDPKLDKDLRMSLLKLFRRCVSTVCDTEATKKIQKVPTKLLVDNYGHTFKPIERLKADFKDISKAQAGTLAALLGEYDSRGQSGYQLTDMFFTWFETQFDGIFSIAGPRGAGRDIELATLIDDFDEDYPCDFVIQDITDDEILCVGFARYDSTRGGAQSDDRTGGNANKVDKAKTYERSTGKYFKLLFIADGPGLTHNDTWEEACKLDGSWKDRVRVATLKLLDSRVTEEWLRS